MKEKLLTYNEMRDTARRLGMMNQTAPGFEETFAHLLESLLRFPLTLAAYETERKGLHTPSYGARENDLGADLITLTQAYEALANNSWAMEDRTAVKDAFWDAMLEIQSEGARQHVDPARVAAPEEGAFNFAAWLSKASRLYW